MHPKNLVNYANFSNPYQFECTDLQGYNRSIEINKQFIASTTLLHLCCFVRIIYEISRNKYHVLYCYVNTYFYKLLWKLCLVNNGYPLGTRFYSYKSDIYERGNYEELLRSTITLTTTWGNHDNMLPWKR